MARAFPRAQGGAQVHGVRRAGGRGRRGHIVAGRLCRQDNLGEETYGGVVAGDLSRYLRRAHRLQHLQEFMMEILLVPIDRSNYRAMWRLKLKPEQQTFVSPPAWSLARCYVRAFGDEFEHLPHLIQADGEVVGYATIACNPDSDEDYWIDDIMIDASQQGRGYGRAAVTETIW